MTVTPGGPAEAEWGATHEALRAALLERVVAVLRADARFIAAWLIGSCGRGEEDAYSDLDLVVVVDTPHAAVLCARPWPSAGRTTPERMALIRQFGTPAVVHEHHANADSLGMKGGTLTLVIYDGGPELELASCQWRRRAGTGKCSEWNHPIACML